MNALQVMDRNWKKVIQVSTWKHGINVQYLYNNITQIKKLGHDHFP